MVATTGIEYLVSHHINLEFVLFEPNFVDRIPYMFINIALHRVRPVLIGVGIRRTFIRSDFWPDQTPALLTHVRDKSLNRFLLSAHVEFVFHLRSRE